MWDPIDERVLHEFRLIDTMHWQTDDGVVHRIVRHKGEQWMPFCANVVLDFAGGSDRLLGTGKPITCFACLVNEK